jgi:hypothetical protein
VSAYSVLAIDPGKTTGLCTAHLYGGKLRLEVRQEELSLSSLHDLVSRTIDSYTPLSIIYEDFSYRNASRMGLDLTPVKLIGVIELFREWHEPFVEFYKQSAATGKAFYTDEKLKGLGIYQKGRPHGRDATRHLMQWANFGAGAQYIDLESIRLELVDG